MTAPLAYDDVQTKKNQLIRKALAGSVFLAPYSADPILTLTTGADSGLTVLPTGYEDAGWMTSAGVVLAEASTTSDTPSWGSVQPTRSDMTSEVTTAVVVLQETKALTIGLYTGADMSTVTPDATTGEVSIAKPLRPSTRYYRLLSLAVDLSDAGEIYVARSLPRVKVTAKDDQAYTVSDDGITWGVTFTGLEDSVLGYSERFLFGGPGWAAMSGDTGFGA